MGMKRVHDFIEDSRRKGYQISGSVFKVDYNGREYNIGFWLGAGGYDSDLRDYPLPVRHGKARHADFDTAVDMAIHEATRAERNDPKPRRGR